MELKGLTKLILPNWMTLLPERRLWYWDQLGLVVHVQRKTRQESHPIQECLLLIVPVWLEKGLRTDFHY